MQTGGRMPSPARNVRSLYDKIHRAFTPALARHSQASMGLPAHPVLPVAYPVRIDLFGKCCLCFGFRRQPPHAGHRRHRPPAPDGDVGYPRRSRGRRVFYRLQRQSCQSEYPARLPGLYPGRRRLAQHRAVHRHGAAGTGPGRHLAGRARLHRAQPPHPHRGGHGDHRPPRGIPGQLPGPGGAL